MTTVRALTSYSVDDRHAAPGPDNQSEAREPNRFPDAPFEFTAADLTSVTYECQLDTGLAEACNPPGKDYPNLKDGTHLFTLKGTDVFGRSSTTSYSWLVDTAKPIVTITSSPRNPTNQTSASFSFRSNKAGSDFRCKLDTGGFSDCKSPKTYGQLGEGTHTFSVKASSSAPTTTFSWTIDLTPPPAPRIGSGPSDPTNASSASFAFSDSEAGLAFDCQLDGGSFAACTSPAAYSGVGAGTHTFAVRATDPAGNTGTAAAYGWTVKDAHRAGRRTRPQTDGRLRDSEADVEPSTGCGLRLRAGSRREGLQGCQGRTAANVGLQGHRDAATRTRDSRTERTIGTRSSLTTRPATPLVASPWSCSPASFSARPGTASPFTRRRDSSGQRSRRRPSTTCSCIPGAERS